MTSVDYDLILSAQRGNAGAFEKLIYKYDRNVLSIALKYVKNENDAKDIYQEVFLRVFRGLKNFKFNSEFSTWLFRITTNVCITFKSKQKKDTHFSINNEEDEQDHIENLISSNENNYTPEKIVENSEISKNINEALENLPHKQKVIFILKHYEGFKIKEIAGMMNCAEGTIKKYLFEAVHKLRNELQEFY